MITEKVQIVQFNGSSNLEISTLPLIANVDRIYTIDSDGNYLGWLSSLVDHSYLQAFDHFYMGEYYIIYSKDSASLPYDLFGFNNDPIYREEFESVIATKQDKYRFSIEANSTNSAYVFSGVGTSASSNPTLYLQRGLTYYFDIDSFNHPLFIQTQDSQIPIYRYDKGVVGNGSSNGTITFTVPHDAPAKLYYNCLNHAAMKGVIYTDDGSSDAFNSVSSNYTSIAYEDVADNDTLLLRDISASVWKNLSIAEHMKFIDGGSSQSLSATTTTTAAPTTTLAPPVDSDFASVVLLLPMNGIKDSTVFPDESNSNVGVTSNGSTQTSPGVVVSDVYPLFGNNAFFDGVDDYLSLTNPNGDLTLGTANFTIEFWMYTSDNAGNITNNATLFISSGGNGPVLRYHNTYNSLAFGYEGVGYDIIPSPAALPIENQWNHVAVVRDSATTTRLYLNGVVVGTSATSRDYTSPVFAIGGTSAASYYSGRIDDFRITSGVARYVGDPITVPTGPHPTS